MSAISGQDIIQRLQWRYATKQFDPARKLSAEQWSTLSEVLRLTPSSYGLQPWKFLLVQNPALRAKLRASSWNQAQIEDCSHLVVLTSLKTVTEAYAHSFIELLATERGITVEAL